MTEVAQTLPTLLGSNHEAQTAATPLPRPYCEDELLGAREPLPPASQAYCDAIMDRDGIIGS